MSRQSLAGMSLENRTNEHAQLLTNTKTAPASPIASCKRSFGR